MPHLTIEYSANLPAAGVRVACAMLHRVLLTDGAFEPGAIRVRAICCAIYEIADGHADNAFFAMVLRIGAGRTEADIQRIGGALLAGLEPFSAPLLEQPHFALSLDIVANEPGKSWKVNSMHPRLRGMTGLS